MRQRVTVVTVLSDDSPRTAHAYAVRVKNPYNILSPCHPSNKKLIVNSYNLNDMIEDREYLKRDLARIYTPHTRQAKSAMKKLREDINRCPELVEALKQTRWNRNRNYYTARQVRLIAEYLCID